MASLMLKTGQIPEAFEVQTELAAAGVPLVWFDDLHPDQSGFREIQLAAIRGVYPLSNADLHASPGAPVTRAEAAQALAAYFGGSRVPAEAAIAIALERGWMAADHRNWFHGDLPFYWADWREVKFPSPIPATEMRRRGPVTRAQLAERLAGGLR
jgi:hypothetical protein